MPLKDKLASDFKDALKSKDTLLKDTIQIVRAGVLQIEKDSKVELDDAGVTNVIAKEIKKRVDVLPDYERSGRDDLIDAVKRQMAILKSYLPEQLTEDEILNVVKTVATEIGATSIKDMGKVMTAVTTKIKGRADNKTVSEIVKKILQ